MAASEVPASTILIVGSSGNLGAEVLRRLVADAREVRALARTPDREATLRSLGVQPVRGDLAEPSSLRPACEGVQIVIATAHALLGRGRQRHERVDDQGHRALIDAARDAGVRHFIYTSVLGASPAHPLDFWRTKAAIEAYLKASGMDYTIVRPSAFMETHAQMLLGAGVLKNGTARILGKGEDLFNVVAAVDVAQLIVRAVIDARFRNRTVEIGGPDNLTRKQIVELYGRLAGVTPSVSCMPLGVVKVLAAVLGPIHPGIGRVMRMAIVTEGVDQSFDVAPLLAEFPMPLTRLEDFVRARVNESRQPNSQG
jgi:NADH dehydrogenase